MKTKTILSLKSKRHMKGSKRNTNINKIGRKEWSLKSSRMLKIFHQIKNILKLKIVMIYWIHKINQKILIKCLKKEENYVKNKGKLKIVNFNINIQFNNRARLQENGLRNKKFKINFIQSKLLSNMTEYMNNVKIFKHIFQYLF